MGFKTGRIVFVFIAVALGACSRGTYEAPELSDAPALVQAKSGQIEVTAPGYGISVMHEGRLQFEVNIEAEDAPHVRVGEACVAYVPPSTAAVSCSVSRVLGSASEETGQAIAWLSPVSSAKLPSGEFVFSEITTSVKKALVVPAAAVLTKDGRTWVVRQEKGQSVAKFAPVEVKTGASWGVMTEILSGLSEGDQVAVQGALGSLYPEFKAGAAD